MTTPEGRYVRLLHMTAFHHKFTALALDTFGAYCRLLVVCDITYPAFIDEESAIAVLGNHRPARAPSTLIEELTEVGLLDVAPGGYRVHNLEQFHVHPSRTPEAERARKRRERAEKEEPDAS